LTINRKEESGIIGGINTEKKKGAGPEEISEARREYLADLERIKELDKKYPRLAEPDEEGIDYAEDDPRRRFIAVSSGATFRKAAPLIDAEKTEADALWEKITGGNYTEK